MKLLRGVEACVKLTYVRQMEREHAALCKSCG